MKEKKSTINRLFEFAQSESIEIIYATVLLAALVTMSWMATKSSFLLTFCAGVNTMFLCMLVKSVKYLAVSYRWYFGLDKDKSKQKLNQ